MGKKWQEAANYLKRLRKTETVTEQFTSQIWSRVANCYNFL
jgi:hypothetical protein